MRRTIVMLQRLWDKSLCGLRPLLVGSASVQARSDPCECYNKGPIDRGACRPYGAVQRRGVAQPGRAPGSGPGGRRFKSSLPDHFTKKPLTRDSILAEY